MSSWPRATAGSLSLPACARSTPARCLGGTSERGSERHRLATSLEEAASQIDKDNEGFYDGLKKHKLLVWRCKTCGASYWPKAYCRNHENEPFAANMEWAEASGRGKIFAFNRHHMAFHPGFKDEIPYVYALIELDEGPLVSSTLVG